MTDKKPPILNIADLQYRNLERGDRFSVKLGDAGKRLGAVKLGYNLSVLPPGKRAFPRHNHTVNEEMFFVLEGEGEVAIGTERFPIRQGDFIACPPGGADTAHQIINTSQVELKYVAVSTTMTPEVVEYPDSQKVGILASVPAEGSGKPEIRRYIVREQAGEKEYWEGEA